MMKSNKTITIKISLTLFLLAMILIGCSSVSSKQDENVKIANPWGETQSVSVVSEWVGFDFIPPAEKITLECGRTIDLTTYRYMTGIAEALYSTDDCKLTFRQSKDLQGTELSGDYNNYSSEWDEDISGCSVHCFGNNDVINLAYYNTSEGHFSITYQCDESDEGLTVSDLTQIMSR